MTAALLTKPRASSIRAIARDKLPLAAVKVWKGGLAACNAAGFYGPAAGTATEIVVGRFYESVDNSAGAAGALTADVQFFHIRQVMLLDNDTVAPVAITDRQRLCSVLDDHTVTAKSGSLSTAGVVYDVTSEGVWVAVAQNGAGQ